RLVREPREVAGAGRLRRQQGGHETAFEAVSGLVVGWSTPPAGSSVTAITEPRGTERCSLKTADAVKSPAGLALPLRVTQASYVLPAGARGRVSATAADRSGATARTPRPGIVRSFAPGLAKTAASGSELAW